ncbi:MAG: alginate export family protein [Candidatus Aminicenantales bacterium]
MMKRLGRALFPFILIVLPPVFAQESGTPPSSPAFKLTFTERIRQESWDNTLSLDEAAPDSTAYVRFRTSLLAQWRPAQCFELAVRLSNENRYSISPKQEVRLGKNYDLNEIFLDYLYLHWKNPGGLPFSLKLGRQDLMLGEGFLIFDGGPLDGSRSAYFNAARLDYFINDRNSIMLFFCRQPSTDIWLPVINDSGQKMVEQDEQGFGAYYSGALRTIKVEGYLFRKNIFASGEFPSSDYNVLGARAIVPLADGLSLTTEGALQSGKIEARPRRGLGGYFHLDGQTRLRFPLPSLITFGSFYLSGDNPATTDAYEGWEASFSRWPKWSESLIYLQARETRPADWTNIFSLYGNLGFTPAERARIDLIWHHLWAPKMTAPSPLLSGSGKERGDLIIAKLTYELNSHISGHFLWEHFLPGDFYFDGARAYAWVRFELMFRY